jgi:hypothetical protein
VRGWWTAGLDAFHDGNCKMLSSKAGRALVCFRVFFVRAVPESEQRTISIWEPQVTMKDVTRCHHTRRGGGGGKVYAC